MPLIVKASVSKVPSISAFPLMSRVAASNSPVSVIFLNPVISLLLSTIAALDAAIVPAVIPSILSKSFSFISASPITNEPAVIAPVAVTLRSPV